MTAAASTISNLFHTKLTIPRPFCRSIIPFEFLMAAPQVGGKTSVRIVVAGDAGTGKSSLIVTAVSENFPATLPPLLPPSRLPDDLFPDRIPVTIIDTNIGDTRRLEEELRRADVVVLTYACDRPETVAHLGTFWLPEFRRLEVNIPIILVGCKLDLNDDPAQVKMEQMMTPIMQQFREIEICLECSALSNVQVIQPFFYAQRAVLFPKRPLYDEDSEALRPRCVRALKRIFILCDHDQDNILSDAELNEFQVKCFNAPLHPDELDGVKRVVHGALPEGLNEGGLTLSGFQYLHTLFIERGRSETIWTVLRKFGYDNDLRLTGDLLPPTFKRAPDQGVELTKNAIEFLMRVFATFDLDNDGHLHPWELHDYLFSTAPDSPWSEATYNSVAGATALGMTPEGFLSMWAFMTLQDPAKTVEYLRYLMYDGDAASAIRVTRKRSIDRKKKKSDRKVFQCFVFGPKGSGKSSLLSALQERPFADSYTTTNEEQFAVGIVDEPAGDQKVLIMREIPELVTPKLLSNKESMAACDLAIFVYDSSDEESWAKMSQQLEEVALQGENSGYQMPCLIVAAKDDLHAYPQSITDSSRVCQDMGVDSPIPISAKLRDFNNLFCRIIRAAERPHLSIPETKSGKIKKQYHRLVNRTLLAVSVGAAVAVVGVAACRVYAARKSGASS